MVKQCHKCHKLPMWEWFLYLTHHPVNMQKTMENHNFWWANQLSIAIFNSYVSFLEGISTKKTRFKFVYVYVILCGCVLTMGYTMVYPNISQNGNRRSPPPWGPGFGGCREWHPAQQAATCLKCRISTCHIIAVIISVYPYSISPWYPFFCLLHA
jgi:hypothetical protein